MTKNLAPSGSDLIASGDSVPNNQNQSDSNVISDDKVQYSTYQKVLGEKKRASEELAVARNKIAEFEASQKEAEEMALKQKEDWKKAYELKTQELEKTKAEFKSQQEIIQDSKKFSAFLESVNGVVDKKFHQFIDVGNVVIDPTTGQPDLASAQQAAREFEKNYPEFIKRGSGPRLPNSAPQHSTGALSVEEWRNLPSKEMKARLKDVMGNHKQ